MVRLLVKGQDEENSFYYICTTQAPIQAVTRNVASICSLIIACRKVSEFLPCVDHKEIRDDNTVTSKLGTGRRDNTLLNYSDADHPWITKARNLYEKLTCCSESDACVSIREASDVLETLFAEMAQSACQLDGDARTVCAPLMLRDFEIKEPCLWCCGKILCAGDGREVLRDFVTVNDRTNLTVYLRSAKDGPPPRSCPIDQAAYKNMVAFYHRREEETKQLRAQAEESRDRDHYLSAEWANPRQLKDSLIGNAGRINYSF